MGRKKKPKEEDAPPPPPPKEEEKSRRRDDDSDDSSDDSSPPRRTYDLDPEIQELCLSFGIAQPLMQKLNDIMIQDRAKTWEQDIERLYEILKTAHSPTAMLQLKVRDMEKGKFVGKAKCTPKVIELCKKHRLDKGARGKLEEAMSMREAMGKDIDKDLHLLDEHLAASNAPSKLVSMKLEALRKGYNVGHCIYSREPMPGNQGPGVDGVMNKRGPKPLGYTDADLDRRFAESQISTGGGQLMDEATVKKMMMAERKKHMEGQAKEAEKKKKDRSRSRSSRSRSPSVKKKKGRSRSGSSKKKDKARRRSPSRQGRRSPSRTGRVKRSRSRSRKRSKSPKRSPSRTKAKADAKRSRSRSGKKKAGRGGRSRSKKAGRRAASKSRSGSRAKSKK